MSLESSTSSRSSGEHPRNETVEALSRKERIGALKNDTDMNNAAQASLAIIRGARRPERQRRCRRRKMSNNVKKAMMMKEDSEMSVCNVNGCEEEEDEEEEEKREVGSKITALQRIVPGGESLGPDKLFVETAGYILALQFQVKALKFLTNFVESSEKEKRKLGG